MTKPCLLGLIALVIIWTACDNKSSTSYPIRTENPGHSITFKYENGWQCTTEPRYADATKDQGTVKVKEIVELGGSREHQVQRLAEIRATAQEIDAAFFAICQDYGTGKITDRAKYDKEYNNLTEIRDLYLRGNIPGGNTTPVTPPDLTTEDRVNRKDNTRVIPTGDPLDEKDGGIFRIELSAPGTITSVQYACEGGVCGYVHPCPDGGKCINRPYDFVKNGSHATFYAWSNSADNGTFKFIIHYRP